MAEFDQFLIDSAVSQAQSVLGMSFPASGYYGSGGWIPISVPTLAPVAVLAAAPSSASAPSHSTTNDQVQGVDEGDIVENDGNYLYILSGSDLKIVDARQPDALTVASSTALDGQLIAEYLNGTRLTIIATNDGSYSDTSGDTIPGSGYQWGLGVGPIVDPPIAIAAPIAVEAVPAVAPVLPAVETGNWTPPDPQVRVTELDVSDPSAPSVIRQTTLDGTYVNSRAVGDQVYLVLQNNLPTLPGPQTHVDGNQVVYETEAEYRARLASLVGDVTLPQFTSNANGQASVSGDEVPVGSIYKPESAGEQSLFAVVSFDAALPAAGPAGAVGAVASSTATVYATPQHLDLFSPQWPDYLASSTAAPSTLIRQFTLAGDSVALTAVGTVPGTVLNQYSVDEAGPYLRVATTETTTTVLPTDSTVDVPGLSNSIYVLAEDSGQLSIVGSLTGIAPGERIYATRFFGDRAYVVTFRQFDPLFAVDMSDPTAPRLAGSLEIPGFSRYLQPIDATHLIGIGQQVANGEPSNVQVSLFDVSDLANPKEVGVATISTGDSYWMTTSEHYDAHQVFYDAATQTLAIPINGYSASGGASDPGTLQDALWVFKVDPASGVTVVGHVDAARPVERAASIGDTLFSISEDAVKAVPLSDPATILGQVQIRDPNDIPPAWGWGGVLWPIDPVISLIPTPPATDPPPGNPGSQPPPANGTPSPIPTPPDHAPVDPPGKAASGSSGVEILGPVNVFNGLPVARGQSDSNGRRLQNGHRAPHPHGPGALHPKHHGGGLSQASHLQK